MNSKYVFDAEIAAKKADNLYFYYIFAAKMKLSFLLLIE